MGQHKLAVKANPNWTRERVAKTTRPVLCAKCKKPLGLKGDYPAKKIGEGVYEHGMH